MDCDKFEATMLDELYGELDELTLAASKRHAAGCARCSSILAGLRATRKLVTLPVLSPSEGFESRLLSAVQAAEPKPKLGLAEVLSLAGRWAMRPQTAMAAVFLLMIGTTSVVVSRKAPHSAAESAFSQFTVTENGSPAAAPVAAASAAPAPDPFAPAEAHGTAPIERYAKAAPAATPPAFAQGPGAGAGGLGAGGGSLGAASEYGDDKTVGRANAMPRRIMAPSKAGAGHAEAFDSLADSTRATDLPSQSPAFAPPPPPPAVAPASQAAAQAQAAEKDESPFDAAQRQYREGDYAGATQSFDGLAAAGDTKAAVMAARSSRDGAGGCPSAVARFDRIAATSFGTENGYDATYEAAQCYARMGQVDEARRRYSRLLTVPQYASRAQQGINGTSVYAAKPRAKMAAPSPFAAPAAPAAPAASTAPSLK